ncbi:MAG: hypothetical protein M3Y54_05420 [Bacteroidota bacterium]|nr:hypothetical protein [Bacteroidota bacterium]
MKYFSPFFLLIGGLSLNLHASAQGSSSIAGSLAVGRPASSTGLLTVVGTARHSSQLPAASRESAPEPAEATAPPTAVPTTLSALGTAETTGAAHKSQLLLVVLEALQAQQVQIAALRAQADAATRRASEAEAAILAFEQRLRQLEAAGSRPSFWR